MVNKLKLILMKIILREQHGFTSGHKIMDSIIMVAETIHLMHSSKFQVNGSVCGFFQATNGFRQGDPLLPFLFVLIVEVLDDTILFGSATQREAYVIKSVLEDYEKDSRQCMNKKKSRIYFLNTNKRIQAKIEGLLQFGQGSFPIKYLGVPLFAGKLDNRMLEEVVNKCKAKSTLWKNKWLSQAGRIQMIKSVLSTIPIYYMSCYRASSKDLSALDDYVQENCRPNSPIIWTRFGESQTVNSVKVADILNSRKIYILSEKDSLI
ncbi:uncharacterized protein LOC131857816 [Cryptomeria japonica]|uniref:uncharacterized protein LOC131857816 n=1 Tax=Cryptomeria japonica TaxID=3369 RepID=UPI0027DA2FA5|nr:uncharacterized protein LOC131857816 [Cryptomeria japonica]